MSVGIQKNRFGTTVAEPIGETRAELPFTGDQVSLFRAQPGRRIGGAAVLALALKKFVVGFFVHKDGSFDEIHTDVDGTTVHVVGPIIGDIIDADVNNPPCEHADSGRSRPRIRDDVAHQSDLMSLGVPR
jgi:hypothetical protein